RAHGRLSTLSLHDALPISGRSRNGSGGSAGGRPASKGPLATDAAPLTLAHAAPDPELLSVGQGVLEALLAHDAAPADLLGLTGRDRKSTRLNSSHRTISYA